MKKETINKLENENNERLDHYLDALQALKYIMSQSEDYYGHWIENIQRDIIEWQTNQDSKIHLGNYGGMGSFNDLGGGSYFTNIQSIAYRLATNPNDIESVEKSMGTLGLQLDGYHCPNCGYNEVYKSKIETYVRNHFVRAEVLEHFRTASLLELMKKRRDLDWSSLDNQVKNATQLALNSNIAVVKDHPWIETCPKCGKKGIDIYHWVLNNKEDQFVPYSLDANALSDNIRSAFK
ncbi:MAG: hypothetical protein GF353_20400 [Candidatus Lokiarchaeota archaeon]|nr:hypothetical protein [Candidatus Lokiarchaeota archaeon]